MDDYDSTNALFNGALLDLPSEDLNDTVDPIVDIIPDNVIPQGFTPIVTSSSLAPSADNTSLEQTLSEPLLTTVTDNTTNISSKSNVVNNRHVIENRDSTKVTSVSPQTTILDIENAFDAHQKHLYALKVG